ncbi:6-phosphogluconate dehydrogenase [Streptomyces sp. alain-838]|nr:NAD(P)-dependent oxidoreductase [Streptomyces sp. alain-838]PAK24173.1 6-phosphogluconate dehydrogenase [Streptomyces sp. alain-838]
MSTPREVRRVGFIGLGSQGGPMARRIAEAGITTTLWARRPEALDAFRDTGAATAGSPARLAAASDLVCLCVLDDAAVEEVVTGRDGVLEGMAEGGVIAVHSTVHPDTVERLAERAADRGVTVLDAPVSGGGPGAEQGRLLVMLGGDADAVERCRPVFATHGDPVVHLGPVGAGQRAKLINNLLLAANMGVAEGAFALAQDLGVDPAQLSVVLEHGSGRSFGTRMVREPDFTLRSASARAGALLQKDVRLLVELAKASGARTATVLDAADAALTSMGRPR